MNKVKITPPTDELTEDFIEAFATKQDCIGAMARMMSQLPLPEGVDESHPQVKQIVQWCKENYPA